MATTTLPHCYSVLHQPASQPASFCSALPLCTGKQWDYTWGQAQVRIIRRKHEWTKERPDLMTILPLVNIPMRPINPSRFNPNWTLLPFYVCCTCHPDTARPFSPSHRRRIQETRRRRSLFYSPSPNSVMAVCVTSNQSGSQLPKLLGTSLNDSDQGGYDFNPIRPTNRSSTSNSI